LKNQPTTIGIPALGRQATDFYLDTINSKWTKSAPCPLLTVAVDFERINEHLPDRYSALSPLLGCMLEDLEESGASVFLVPNITLHAALDRMEFDESTRRKIVSPMSAGVEAMHARGIHKITLAGTRHTMTSRQIADYYETEEIAVEFPSESDIQTLDRIRLKVFKEGYNETLKNKMERVLSGYKNVVLACTELSILNPEKTFTDMARLQISAALRQL